MGKTIKKEQWYRDILNEIDTFNQRLNDKIEKEEALLKERKKKTELEKKLAQETKLHHELTQKLAEVSHRGLELARVCSMLKTQLTIGDNDQYRLNNAKDNYQLSKELTGIRFDFSAPPGIVKGYVKSSAQKLLQPFNLPAEDPEALWSQIEITAAPGWPKIKEKRKPLVVANYNMPNNK